jgi:acyl-CoA thioesterase 8
MDDARTTTTDDSVELSKSLVESLLAVSPLPSLNETRLSFKNAQPIWLPPGARGIYGGLCIAQSLVAAQRTVSSSFAVHSMHGQFAVAGNADEALIYHVSKVNDGRSFATRTVDVMQKDRTIFTAIINFVRLSSTNGKEIKHSEPMPEGIPGPPTEDTTPGLNLNESSTTMYPYLTKKVGIVNSHAVNPHEKCIHQWNKANGKVTPQGGVHAHLAAMAYICDNYFVGTIPHVHGIWDFVKPPLTEFDVGGPDPALASKVHDRIPEPNVTHQVAPVAADSSEDGKMKKKPRIGMMVTLSHTMFFHAPTTVRADEWMLAEYRSHWADGGRGLATQKIWSREGVLLATCVQEGIIRLEDLDRGVRKGSSSSSSSRTRSRL